MATKIKVKIKGKAEKVDRKFNFLNKSQKLWERTVERSGSNSGK